MESRVFDRSAHDKSPQVPNRRAVCGQRNTALMVDPLPGPDRPGQAEQDQGSPGPAIRLAVFVIHYSGNVRVVCREKRGEQQLKEPPSLDLRGDLSISGPFHIAAGPCDH